MTDPRPLTIEDCAHCLCEDQRCHCADTIATKTLLDEVESDHCVCSAAKEPLQVFCPACMKLLPPSVQRSLPSISRHLPRIFGAFFAYDQARDLLAAIHHGTDITPIPGHLEDWLRMGKR